MAVGLDRTDGGRAQIFPIEVVGKPCERRCRNCVGGGRRAVGSVAVTYDELFVISGGAIEGPALPVNEIVEHALEQPLRFPQIFDLTARFVEIDQALTEVRVILQVTVQVRLLGPVCA